MSDLTIIRPAERATAEPQAMRELTRFLILAFVVSWIVGLAGISLMGLMGLGLGALCPGLVALWLTKRERGSVRPLWDQIIRWRIGWRWYAAALLTPAAVLGAAYLTVGFFGGAWQPEMAPALSAVPVFLVLAVVFAGGPEEPGWRGYALPRLQMRFNALTATLILGVIWAAWHAPLWFIPDLPFDEMSYPLYAAQILGMSLVYTWLYNATSGSVLAVMLLHAAQNTAQQYVPTTTEAQFVIAALWLAIGLSLVAKYGPDSLAPGPRVDSQAAERAVRPVRT